MELLGNDIRRIAWHKGGIFKTGSPAFSVPQTAQVALELANRAEQKGVNLQIVTNSGAVSGLFLPVLRVEEQRINATLALALTNCFLEAHKRTGLTSSDVSRGVNLFRWPGRFQQIHIGRYQWFVDGAHNAAGIQVAAHWFSQSIVGIQRCYTMSLHPENAHVGRADLTKCLYSTDPHFQSQSRPRGQAPFGLPY